MIATKQTDDQLIDLILSGKKQAYRELVERYQSYVYTIVAKILNHHEESEDVSQEVFIKVFRYLPKFNRRSKFSTWLYRIAVNTAISHRRKRQFKEDVDQVQIVDDSNSDDVMKLSEQQRYLKEAFALLKEDDVVVLTLFYLKELSLEEISEITKIEANTVKVKLYRARKRLSGKMKLILKQETSSLL